MNVRLHEVRHCLVDQLMTAQRRQPHKSRAADRDVEMSARTSACMPCVQRTVVTKFQ